jgi:IS30 family transposase
MHMNSCSVPPAASAPKSCFAGLAAAEQRKELAILFKEAEKERPLSNRKIAKTLNVHRRTIDRDVGPNDPPQEENISENKAAKNVSGSFGPRAVVLADLKQTA